MVTRTLEMEWLGKGKPDQKETDFYPGDILVCHFRTPGPREMEPGGNGGQIAIVAHNGPSATRHAVLSLTAGDFDNPVSKKGDQTATTIYCYFNEDPNYGVRLEPLTDYYWTVEITNGPDTNCAALVNLTGR